MLAAQLPCQQTNPAATTLRRGAWGLVSNDQHRAGPGVSRRQLRAVSETRACNPEHWQYSSPKSLGHHRDTPSGNQAAPRCFSALRKQARLSWSQASVDSPWRSSARVRLRKLFRPLPLLQAQTKSGLHDVLADLQPPARALRSRWQRWVGLTLQ